MPTGWRAAHGLRQGVLDLAEREWLGDHGRPATDLGLALLGRRGADDERDVLEAGIAADVPREVAATAIGQVVVDDHHGGRILMQRIPQGLQGGEGARAEADILRHLGEQLEGGNVVVDDIEQRRLALCAPVFTLLVGIHGRVLEAHA